jgi:hypothetical protein
VGRFLGFDNILPLLCVSIISSTFSYVTIFSCKAGLGVAAIGAMPSVGLYFGIYSYSKRTIIPRLQQTLGPTREGSYIISDNAATTIGIAASAAIGNTFASFSRVPFEVVKQRLQTGKYPNTRTALAAMFRSEGMRGFFPLGGICTQMVRDIPCKLLSECLLFRLFHQMSCKIRFDQSHCVRIFPFRCSCNTLHL